MFGRKKKEEAPNPKSTLDKIIMGAIIGTAIGSVIGLSVAPKKGEETRKILKENYAKEIKEIGKLGKETATGAMKLVKNLLKGLFKNKIDSTPSMDREYQSLKKIPDETATPVEAPRD